MSTFSLPAASSTSEADSFRALDAAIHPARQAVVTHPVYSRIGELPALRTFMTNHAFAVWDFMSLLKTLQRRLTCIDVPWLPPSDVLAARLVNEIVLGEESDEIRPGVYSSHYDLYISSMNEIGADTGPIEEFVTALMKGLPPAQALGPIPVPSRTREFVFNTLSTCGGSTVEVAAAFLLGREDLVPAMFREIIARLEASGVKCPSFSLYLDRHVHLDEEQHGPMAKRLLQSLCGDDQGAWDEARRAALHALTARKTLWDGVLESL